MNVIYYLGVIPARGGSKGIPRKNIRLLGGRPLIAWTIEAAKNSSQLSRFVVSTEDPEIKRVAQRWGAEVLDRPPSLATDTASTWDVLKHALTQIPARAVVLLQPTSPVRRKGLIDQCIDSYEQWHTDTVATGFNCKFKPYGTYTARRQDLKGFFYDDGNVYVIRSGLIHQGKRVGRRIGRFPTSREENIEIDDKFDFWLAEKVMSAKGKMWKFDKRSRRKQ
jgi:CMP-N-acetylneuraminic acid synthetase